MFIAPSASPWHEGERRLQRQAGVAERMDAVGRKVIRDHLIDQHRLFYPQLPFVVLGAVDPVGDAWATLRARPPGFLAAPDPTHLAVALRRDPADPAEAGLEDGDAVGLLGIELATRRRNRLNGTIHRDGPEGFVIAVEQSFGNCPRYIQRRDAAFVRPADVPTLRDPVVLDRLDGAAGDLVRRADTLFVASYAVGDDGQRRVDVSHRGGRAGFVRLDADGGLTVPDFNGNLFFNTLGNILVNPHAGLTFVDFERGDLLQMTGDAEILLDDPAIADFEGAERLWRFHPRRVVLRAEALPLRWGFTDWSPQTLLTGVWPQEGSAKQG